MASEESVLAQTIFSFAQAPVKASQQSLQLTMNQYKAGTVSYLNVSGSQTAQLNNERTAVDIMGHRMSACVLLIKALGGMGHIRHIVVCEYRQRQTHASVFRCPAPLMAIP